jgi:hypothetical protein
VIARVLREDATDFDYVDGHIDATLDFEPSGESIRAMPSMLGAVANTQFHDRRPAAQILRETADSRT